MYHGGLIEVKIRKMLKIIKNYLQSLFLYELFKGLSLTGRYMVTKPFTLEYPEEKAPVSSSREPCKTDALPRN